MIAPALLNGTFIASGRSNDDPVVDNSGLISSTFWLWCALVEYISLTNVHTLTQSKDLVVTLCTPLHLSPEAGYP